MKSFAHLIGLLLVATSSFACSCGDPPPCAQVGADSVIFIGSLSNAPRPWPFDFLKARIARFKIEKTFKGLPDGTQFVEVDTAEGSSCEATFSVGVSYLVYAKADKTRTGIAGALADILRSLILGRNPYSGLVSTTACKGSKPLHEAADDIRFMDAFVAHRTITSIHGLLFVETGQSNFYHYAQIQKRLAGSTVSVSSSEGQQYSGISDAKGEFRIEPVRAGSYKVRVQQAKFRSELAEYDLSVPAGGCGEAYVSMGFDGSVAGRLREAQGRSPGPVKVQLIPVLKADIYPLPLETTSANDGTYVFRRVPPGRYVLAVNASQEPTIRNPYRRAFYPGVEDQTRASLIHVGESKSLHGIDLKLSAKLNSRSITAEAQWSDGTPARNVHIWCAPTGYTAWQHLLTDGQGRITFEAMDGLSYEIGAEAASNYEIPAKQRISARPIHVPPGQSTSVRLVLSIPPRQGQSRRASPSLRTL